MTSKVKRRKSYENSGRPSFCRHSTFPLNLHEDTRDEYPILSRHQTILYYVDASAYTTHLRYKTSSFSRSSCARFSYSNRKPFHFFHRSFFLFADDFVAYVAEKAKTGTNDVVSI